MQQKSTSAIQRLKNHSIWKYLNRHTVAKTSAIGGTRYAGFGMRMFAAFIDSTLSIIILLPFFTMFYKVYGTSNVPELLATGALKPEDISKEQMIDLITTQIVSFSVQNTIFAIAVLCFWFCCSATPGKMLFKMQIVDAKTGKKPSRTQFFIRYIGYFLAFLPLGLGFIWIHYDKKKQGWHDKLAGTVVVYKQ